MRGAALNVIETSRWDGAIFGLGTFFAACTCKTAQVGLVFRRVIFWTAPPPINLTGDV
jgi:hypothetical protein